ncbi:hypothetical protein N9357_03810 [bacterium]|jgi:hypothetical protein|nr:hypothetical protein [bacterium]
MQRIKSFLIKGSFFTLFLFVSLNPAFASSDNEGGSKSGEHDPTEHLEASCSNVTYGKSVNVESLYANTKTKSADIFGSVVSPNPAGQVIVDLGLHIVELTKVDEVTNTFNIEGFMDLVWCDPRMAYEVENGEELSERILLKDKAQALLNEIWWPAVTIANQVNGRNIENQELVILSDGTIEYKEKFSAELEAHYDLKKFPFDRQKLEIEIESFAWHDEVLLFQMNEEKIGFSNDFEIAEWHIEKVESKIESVKGIQDRASFSEFLMEIVVVRQYEYYLWKIITPLIFLVIVSWSVFLMIGEKLADRLRFSMIGILTIVSFQFIISDILPRVSYFTLMDSFLSISFFIMLLTMLESVYVNNLDLVEESAQAKKLDMVSRIAFPVLYFVSLATLALIFFL